jgi:hypothetical protein
MSKPKFALVRWGAELKYGQARRIRLAKVMDVAAGGGLHCQTKPGAPDDLTKGFTTVDNFYLAKDVLKTWARMPSVKEIRAELDRISREATLAAGRAYGKIIESIIKGGPDAR